MTNRIDACQLKPFKVANSFNTLYFLCGNCCMVGRGIRLCNLRCWSRPFSRLLPANQPLGCKVSEHTCEQTNINAKSKINVPSNGYRLLLAAASVGGCLL